MNKYVNVLSNKDIYNREVTLGVYEHSVDAYAMKAELEKYDRLTSPFNDSKYLVRRYPIIDMDSAITSLRNQRMANNEIEEDNDR